MKKSMHGGKRDGAGRKKKADSVVLRVPKRYVDTLKLTIKVLRQDSNAEYRIIEQIPRLFRTDRTLEQIEQDAEQAINSLKKQLEVAKQDNESIQLRKQLDQLTSELYPALKRLRELDPNGRW